MPYDRGNGTAKFSLDQPVPYDLIARLGELLAPQQAGRAGT